MSSQKKKRKLKNSFAYKTALKNKLPSKLKRAFFYTSSERKRLEQTVKEQVDDI